MENFLLNAVSAVDAKTILFDCLKINKPLIYLVKLLP